MTLTENTQQQHKIMATASKRGKFIYEQVYEENDLVDKSLFNVVSKHVNRDNINLFGLKFGEDLPIDPFGVKEHMQRVSKILVFVKLKEI